MIYISIGWMSQSNLVKDGFCEFFNYFYCLRMLQSRVETKPELSIYNKMPNMPSEALKDDD